nr:GE004860 [Streptomyces sp.]
MSGHSELGTAGEQHGDVERTSGTPVFVMNAGGAG